MTDEAALDGAVPGAQTADRVLQLLAVAISSERPLDLADFGELTGFNKAVTRRLVQALMKHALLERHPDGRHYVVGSGMVGLAAGVMERLSVREAALPAMTRLAEFTSETVSLHVRHLRLRVCVAAVDGRHPVRWVVPLGEALPLFVGLSGRTLLAHLSQEDIDAVLADATAAGIQRADVLASIMRVREDGYLADVGARIPGLGGLSAPVFDSWGVAASLTVSGPGDRFTREVAEQSAPTLLRECEQISAALGGGAAVSPS